MGNSMTALTSVSRSLGLAFILLGAVLVQRATAQEPLQAAYQRASRFLVQGRYLEAAETLRPLALDRDGNMLDPMAFQLWNQVQVNVTGTAFHPVRAPGEEPALAPEAALASARSRDALREIVERARRTRIVILNEDHVTPRQRAFALDVARALRPLGYDILALEALDNSGDRAARMAALASRGYPLLGDGVYTREPVFADFVRQALHMGYRPVSYEDANPHQGLGPTASIEARDQAQAENLAALLRANPGSRFFIYVGGSHLAERPLSAGGETTSWMAARLARLAGIDPLTIDQVTLRPDCRPCARLARSAHRGPVVYFRGNRPVVLGQYAGAVDLQVYAPQIPAVAGRPGWLAAMGRTASLRPRHLVPSRGLRLVQAFIASEGEVAIPIDQILVAAGSDPPALMLPAVLVRFATQDDVSGVAWSNPSQSSHRLH
jgi:hypothetical protein